MVQNAKYTHCSEQLTESSRKLKIKIRCLSLDDFAYYFI